LSSFHKTSISRLRLFLLCTVIVLTASMTYQLVVGNSITSASLASTQSTPMTTQTLTVPANNFSVISGSISGLADNSIYDNVARVRASMTSPIPGVVSASYHFKILGNSPTVMPDSDGVTRQGVVFWVNMQNACNLYFLFWRTDSTQPAGTTTVGAKVQANPSITSQTVNNSDLIACAGIGYSTISQPDGTSAETISNVNIMDGNWHDFTIVKLGPERWRLYTDSVFVFEAYDSANNFPVDSNLWGLRLDNVQIQLYYRLTINTTSQFSTWFTFMPPTGLTGQSISFSASASGGSQPYSYSWNFGDGVGTSTVQSPTYSYGSPGTYTVTLLTTDSAGATATSSQTVTVTAPSQPRASFTFSPSSPSQGTTISFTPNVGGGTLPYSYSWDFGDGATSSVAYPSHLYTLSGSYTIQLTVTDNTGQSTSTFQTITVVGPQIQPLTASFDYQPSLTTVGATITFTAVAAGGTGPYIYNWRLGDGSTASGTSIGHMYMKAGNYTVILTTTDYLGETTTSSMSLSVSGGSTAPSQPSTQPPSNPSSGGTCILCDASRLVPTLSLLTIGLFGGGFLSVGIFLSKYHAENRRLAAELRSRYQMSRSTPSLRVKQTKSTRRRINREYRALYRAAWSNQHRSG